VPWLDEATLVSFSLVSVRSVLALAPVPPFGGHVLPPPARILLGLCVAVLIWPNVPGLERRLELGELLVALAREAAIGAAIGFLAALPFRAVEAAGRLVDALRGANLAELLSPELGARTSPTAELYLRLTTVWFLASGAYRGVIFALADGFDRLPIGGGAALLSGPRTAIAATGAVLEGAAGIALPALASLLLADLTLGVVGRAAPGLGLQGVLMSGRALVGVVVTALSLGVVLATVARGLGPALLGL